MVVQVEGVGVEGGEEALSRLLLEETVTGLEESF